ncbi:MAG: D-glycero-beta-D-manno-heptose 1-phosphate adenylyltransferase [Planctomycetota bacterium]|nr:MAG: D-glycero-beta-D-manno-heptose 1-phosphate adenylyltransferase [Planctomycetota bacterium]
MASIFDLLEKLGAPRVLVVGDLILDRYVDGEAERVSPEAPVLVFRSGYTSHRLGGACNVAANVVRAGGVATVLGLVGDDEAGDKMRSLLSDGAIDLAGVIVDESRPTTLKTRFVSKTHQVLRVDDENVHAPAPEALAQIRSFVEGTLGNFDAVILSDYGKGMLSGELLQLVIRSARADGVPVLVDPKGVDFRRYAGATLITPNKLEAERASGRSIDDEDSLLSVGEQLIETAQLDSIVITLGKDGIYYRDERGGRGTLPTEARSVFDVTGAGDTVVAWLGMTLGAGLDLESAVRLANLAAGVTVGRFGTASVSRDELRGQVGAHDFGRILDTTEQLQQVLNAVRAKGKRIVFTNGCFDLLHPGHLDYLKQARSYGDLLIVGINEDASIRKAKGANRPFCPLHDRMEMLLGLEAVDYVVPFAEDTPLRLIEEVQPQVLVKGEDWRDKGVVGREFVEAHGGQVVLIRFKEGYSTSSLVRRIQAAHPE